MPARLFEESQGFLAARHHYSHNGPVWLSDDVRDSAHLVVTTRPAANASI
jgi:hypothetical protein